MQTSHLGTSKDKFLSGWSWKHALMNSQYTVICLLLCHCLDKCYMQHHTVCTPWEGRRLWWSQIRNRACMFKSCLGIASDRKSRLLTANTRDTGSAGSSHKFSMGIHTQTLGPSWSQAACLRCIVGLCSCKSKWWSHLMVDWSEGSSPSKTRLWLVHCIETRRHHGFWQYVMQCLQHKCLICFQFELWHRIRFLRRLRTQLVKDTVPGCCLMLVSDSKE